MTRKDLGKITLAKWENEKLNWRYNIRKMKRESPGKTFCLHKYKDYKGCEMPTGLEADVIFPHGTARVYEGRTVWEICVKCGRIKLTYEAGRGWY